MKKSLLGIIGFGLLLAYSLFVLFLGESPGGMLLVSIVGLVVSAGNYLAT
jgi:hypothetical protein